MAKLETLMTTGTDGELLDIVIYDQNSIEIARKVGAVTRHNPTDVLDIRDVKPPIASPSQTITLAGDFEEGAFAVIEPSAGGPAAPVIATLSPIEEATVGVAYSKTFVATGATGPYTWLVDSGTLTAGLTLSSAGILSGTPTTANTYIFTLEVTCKAQTAIREFTHVVNAAPLPPVLITTPPFLDAAEEDLAYSETLVATGGDTTYTWAVIAGTLPAGITLSAGGVLSGTPTTPGDYGFTVQATSVPATLFDRVVFSLSITPTPPTPTGNEPLPTDPGAVTIFSDNFNSHADVAAMVAHWDTGTPGGFTLISPGQDGTGKAWRTTYVNEQDWYILAKAHPVHRNIFVSFWFRFMTTGGDPMSNMPTAGLKFIWWDHEHQPTPTINTKYVDPAGSPPNFELDGTFSQATDTHRAHYQFDIVHGAGPKRGGFHESPFSYSSRLMEAEHEGGVWPIFATYADTGWHKITIEIKTVATPVSAGFDGYAKMWLDGVIEYDDATRVTPILYYAQPNSLILPANVSHGSMTPFHLDIDDFFLWRI